MKSAIDFWRDFYQNGRDKALKIGTVLPKTGRMLSLRHFEKYCPGYSKPLRGLDAPDLLCVNYISMHFKKLAVDSSKKSNKNASIIEQFGEAM